MIHKVNRPSFLSLVQAPSQTENDPGSSQGSGLLYDGPASPESPTQKDADAENAAASDASSKEKNSRPLAVVSNVEQPGMTEMIKNFYEHKEEHPTVNRVGLTTKYSTEGSPAKGLLLNKKAE